MPLATLAAQIALDRLLGLDGDTPENPFTPAMFSPAIVKIRDPVAEVDELVEFLDEGTLSGQERNALLAKLTRNEGLGVDAAGKPTWNGRRCCYAHVLDIESKIHRIPMGTEFECACTAVYRVQRGTRRDG